jgi:haloalkane dehalogenase
LHYVDERPGADAAAPETLLFVHGNPTWSFHWREPLRAWRGKHRLIAPDHLGCGMSDRPTGWPYRLQDHIDNLARLVERLDLRQVTLVAQDWGGAIGLGAALTSPDRYARFVLLNTGAFRPWFIPWRIRVCRTPLLGRLAVQGMNLFLRAAFYMAVADRRSLSPPVRAGYLAPYGSWKRREAIYRFVEDIPASPANPTYQTLARIESELPSLGVRPWQLIWGMRDWCFTPACLDKFRELIPQARVHRFEDAGHWVLEEAPEQIIALVEDFLADTPVNRTRPLDRVSATRNVR